MTKPTRLDYCQYLLSTPINYTLTHFADHCEAFSHDQINRYLAGTRLRPRYVWENVKSHLEQTPDGYLLFDDTVLEKRYAKEIAIAQRQYSGNAGGIINGIGIVMYCPPKFGPLPKPRLWYNIHDLKGGPDGETKTKKLHP